MKLKLVVASMSVLGLVSCPVFAGHMSKHKHHQKVVKQMEATHDYKDYKDMGPAAEVCMISASSMTMNEMSQNMGRSMPNPCNPGWFNRIQFSGGLNVDLGKFGNRNANYMGENYQRFSLNDAYLNVAASVNDWAKAFASISYNTATIHDPNVGFGNSAVAEYSSAYSNNVVSGGSSTVQLEQAYATFGNFDMSPFFLQVGKQFQDFSRYEIHPITRSLTQVLSETLATSLEGGFIANGFNGTLFAFDDPLAKVGQTNNPTNYGLALGYNQPSDQLGWDIGGAYLYNLIGVNDVAYAVNQNNIIAGTGNGNGGYNTRVAGTAWYADVNSGPFTLGARYTAALQRFNQTDLGKNGNNPAIATSNTGAKPWAAGIQAGYGFDAWGKDQNIYVGYQAARETAGMLTPEARWVLGYGIEMFGKNTNLGIEWDRDLAYSQSNGGTGNNTNLVSVRSSVKFG